MGDGAAAVALLQSDLDWAAGLARQFWRRLPRSFEVEDLIQAAHIGLWKAATRYRPERNDNWRAWAYTYVLGEMRMSVRKRRWLDATLLEGLPDHLPVPASPPDDSMARMVEVLRAVLEDLQDPHGQVLRMLAAGCPVPIIATALRRPVPVVHEVRLEALALARVELERRGWTAAAVAWT